MVGLEQRIACNFQGASLYLSLSLSLSLSLARARARARDSFLPSVPSVRFTNHLAVPLSISPRARASALVPSLLLSALIS